jgi:hypothetical protein
VRLVVSKARHADDLLEELDRELDFSHSFPSNSGSCKATDLIPTTD